MVLTTAATTTRRGRISSSSVVVVVVAVVSRKQEIKGLLLVNFSLLGKSLVWFSLKFRNKHTTEFVGKKV